MFVPRHLPSPDWARFLLFSALALLAPVVRADFDIVVEGRPTAVVCVAKGASSASPYAAKELVKYVKAMTGAELPVVADSSGARKGRNVILIGEKRDNLRRDEIVLGIDQDGRCLHLCGEGPRGGLYATYELLERWGVRFFGNQTEKIPTAKSLSLPDGFAFSYAPPFEFRKPGSIPLDQNMGPPWAVKLRVSRSYQNKNYGGAWDAVIGSGHSLGNKSFLDAKVHFAQHPEWYALVGGKRIPNGQLCLSNPEVRAELLKEVRAKAAGKKGVGGIKYISLSYLDNNRFCTCDGCRKIRKRWGDAPIGPALDVANFVAKEIEGDLPGFRISTLAYWDWREPPAKTPGSLHTNVYVTICQNGNKALPVARQKDLMERLRKWNAVAPGRLLIWDWDACFRNYLTPYPTYHLYAEDFRTYRKLGVRQVLSQLPHGAIFADFVEMRTYLYAKLAWNPDLDGEAMAREWIDYCCGSGAPQVWEYYQLVERAVWGNAPAHRNTQFKLHGYNPGRGWLTAKDRAEAFLLFEKALAATADEPQAHAMVRRLGAGLLELVIEQYADVKKAMAHVRVPYGSARPELPPREELVDRFEQIGKDFYVWCFREGPQPRDFASLVKTLREGTRK